MVLQPRQSATMTVALTDVLWHDEVSPPQPPNLKTIRLKKLHPKQFGLDRWTRTFVIPNNWMRKIYKRDAYHDTEQPPREPEKITEAQRKLLYDWLQYKSPFRIEQPDRNKFKRHKRNLEPTTDLIRIFDSAADSDSSGDEAADELDPMDERSIPMLIGHQYQPEHMIVRKAIQNMRVISKQQGEQIKDFMSDPALMKMFHKQVSDHLGRSRDGYAV